MWWFNGDPLLLPFHDFSWKFQKCYFNVYYSLQEKCNNAMAWIRKLKLKENFSRHTTKKWQGQNWNSSHLISLSQHFVISSPLHKGHRRNSQQKYKIYLIIGNKLTTEDRIANTHRNVINTKYTSYRTKRRKKKPNCFSEGLLAPSLPSPSGNEASPGGSPKSHRFVDSQGDHRRFKAGIGTCLGTRVPVSTEVETGPWSVVVVSDQGRTDSSLFLGGS